jgi:hypothetical protein
MIGSGISTRVRVMSGYGMGAFGAERPRSSRDSLVSLSLLSAGVENICSGEDF